jgi:hypothetical protein
MRQSQTRGSLSEPSEAMGPERRGRVWCSVTDFVGLFFVEELVLPANRPPREPLERGGLSGFRVAIELLHGDFKAR